MPIDSYSEDLSAIPASFCIQGKGRLICAEDKEWQCGFLIRHLLNGRLQVAMTP